MNIVGCSAAGGLLHVRFYGYTADVWAVFGRGRGRGEQRTGE